MTVTNAKPWAQSVSHRKKTFLRRAPASLFVQASIVCAESRRRHRGTLKEFDDLFTALRRGAFTELEL